ncbi:MAG: thioredoxin family protein [Thiobacillus sp.]|nr:thioredoxin family protein [Thiobacillus sp.]
MDVKILATKACTHRQALQLELEEMGVACVVWFVEDHPDIVARHGIRHSPNLLVGDRVVFRGQPTPLELRDFFGNH